MAKRTYTPDYEPSIYQTALLTAVASRFAELMHRAPTEAYDAAAIHAAVDALEAKLPEEVSDILALYRASGGSYNWMNAVPRWHRDFGHSALQVIIDDSILRDAKNFNEVVNAIERMSGNLAWVTNSHNDWVVVNHMPTA